MAPLFDAISEGGRLLHAVQGLPDEHTREALSVGIKRTLESVSASVHLAGFECSQLQKKRRNLALVRSVCKESQTVLGPVSTRNGAGQPCGRSCPRAVLG